MSSEQFDFAVFGSTAMARLVAGLLAGEHGKRVCLVGAPPSPYRLARHVDISVAPLTRPETWLLLKRTRQEAQKLLGSVGRGVSERIDPVFVAEAPASVDRLGHVRHMAGALGFSAERVNDRAVAGGGTALRIRDALVLVRGKFDTAAETWLGKRRVQRIAADGKAHFAADGVTIELDKRTVSASAAVLADDAAILDHLPTTELARLGLVNSSTLAVTTEPAKALPDHFIGFLDREVTLYQRGGKGSVLALAGGNATDAAQRIGSGIGSPTPLRRAGQAVFRALRTADAAPVIGRTAEGHAALIAGLGDIGAFLAPVLARHLVGKSTADEQAWVAARDGSSDRALVTEAAFIEAAA